MTVAQWFIVIAALIAANLPFLRSRGFLVFLRREAPLTLAWRLLELLVWYFAIGLLARILEANTFAAAYPQHWEFYAITLCLFVVFAYPGFVFRYLWQKP